MRQGTSIMVQLRHALGEASVPAGPGRGAGCCCPTAVRPLATWRLLTEAFQRRNWQIHDFETGPSIVLLSYAFVIVSAELDRYHDGLHRFSGGALPLERHNVWRALGYSTDFRAVVSHWCRNYVELWYLVIDFTTFFKSIQKNGARVLLA